MTDTEVKINGRSAGEIHQGVFYQFDYNISDILLFGDENLLEVAVSKHSANESINETERKCDYWIFGGIFRPVYLAVKPREHIERVEIDAKADGTFRLNAFVQNIEEANQAEIRIRTLNGKTIGSPFTKKIQKETNLVLFNEKLTGIKTLSPEYPNLYVAEIILKNSDKIIHKETEHFGFRTVEIRERDGIYVNGVKIKFNGINHHSFWPSSGKTTSKKISIDDVNLIKDMNMNAVRMSHYPPDKHFLDVCDSLGLFVHDELAGWQTAYDTEVGEKLVREIIYRDMNHPSVVIWDNENEGGENTELYHLFDELDFQKRPLIHPYQIFRKSDTDHYQEYNYGTGRHLHGNKVVFPTEFLHGLYDGGHGAGLEDYWRQMWDNPISVGGFLLDFSDQAVVRTDIGGVLDIDGNHGADGILGPYREKESSFYAVKEIWSPMYFEKRFITPEFNGELTVENRFHYTNLKDCNFSYRLVTLPVTGQQSETLDYEAEIAVLDILPGCKGVLKLKKSENFSESDVLYITATDPSGREIYTWSWPITSPKEVAERSIPQVQNDRLSISENKQLLTLTNDTVKLSWDKSTGLLHSVENLKGKISFDSGPVLIEGETAFDSLIYYQKDKNVIVEAIHSGAMRLGKWAFFPNGWLKLEVKYAPPYKTEFMGISFNSPESYVKSVRWLGFGPYRVWKNRMTGGRFNVWEKEYNNTVTGESGYIYPEFKGYHKNFYWATIQPTEQDFDILTESEDIFLRLFTPEPPGFHPSRVSPPFPVGDISFKQGINTVGTKIFKAEQLGPMSQKNIFSNRWGDYTKDVELYFNYTGNQFNTAKNEEEYQAN
jgi:hypothetical protein